MYKTILVHVDATAASHGRVDAAIRMAMANEAHLVGTAMTDLSGFMFPVSVMGAGMPPVVFPVDDLRANADRALDQFDTQARAAGVSSFERRRLDDEAGVGLCLQARYADLLVVSQSRPHVAGVYSPPDTAQYVVLNCARPVLVLPEAGAGAAIGERVAVAWNGSPQAVRAIASAIPLLKRAASVHLLVIKNDGDDPVHGEQPGADMALYLARHGIKVEVDVRHSANDDGGQLLTFASDKGADLIVMGAFGHSRLREFVLGGVTRTALRRSPIPLWMAH